jgi:D-amino-acid dehydrogenase
MKDVLVLGGGMVGVTTALALQARGRQVALVDRGAPTCSSSYGNAGIIQVEAAEPYAMPRGFDDLLAIALGRSNAVAWSAAGVLGALGPLWSYFRASAPLRHRQITRHYAGLTRRAADDHAPLIAAAGAEPLIRRDGFRQAYRSTARLDGAVARAERLAREHGVKFAAVDGAALIGLEPGLRRPMAGAVHWPEAWTCSDPGKLVQAYTDLFRGRGGAILKADALSLERRGSGWRVGPAGNGVDAAEAVIALGMGSATLCRRLGLHVPLFAKRGYHRHFAPVKGPDLPFVDVESSAVLAPMSAGMRLSTGAEIAREGAPIRTRQLDQATRAAAELFDLGPPVDAAWAGARPCIPDMLPVVGAFPGQPGIWLNFGHGHQGFTLGPTTAALLAEAMSGGAAAPEALSPARFLRR